MKPMNQDSVLEMLMNIFASAVDSGKKVKVTMPHGKDEVETMTFEPADLEDDLPFADEDECDRTSCDTCLNFEACMDGEMYADPEFDVDDDFDPPCWGIPDIRRVIFSGPATIVFWEDNTKTIVKCMKGERFERYAGFAAACMKKMFGSTSRAKSIMNEFAEEQLPNCDDDKSNGKYYPDLTEAMNSVIANHESVQEAINETFNG